MKKSEIRQIIREELINEVDYSELVKQAQNITTKLKSSDLDSKTIKKLKTALQHINSLLDRV